MTKPTIFVDGLEPKPGVTLWGVATPTSDGLWRCYANVHGVLCVVALTVAQIKGDDPLPPGEAYVWDADKSATLMSSETGVPEPVVHEPEEAKQEHAHDENHNNVDDQPDFRIDRHNAVEQIEHHANNDERNEESDHPQIRCTERAEVTFALKTLDDEIATANPDRVVDSSGAPDTRGPTDVDWAYYDGLIEARRRVAARLAGCVVLPGWRCKAQGCFGWMGAEKEELTHCRACGAHRP